MAKIAQLLPNHISGHFRSLNGGLILTVLLSSMFLSAVPAEAFLKKRIIVSRIKKRKMVDFLMK